MAPDVLLLPGWQNSDPAHWQSRWEALHGDRRVEQHDWMRPLRGDWSAQLEEAVLAANGPVVLVAHSLGCILVAAWAAHSRNTHRVQFALLVAPGDLERDDLRQMIPGWAPIVRTPLPFPSCLVAADNDVYCAADRSRQLAADWGARLVDAGPRGHLNSDSGLGDWPEGRALLPPILKD
ncbi:RBBP9/YdeN family alpha/beta hydrolase [Variovorax sp. PAMC 28711]|uniref:RBBP9/YdeN family alpha/beta hydrolase n=1 Tax=Variovorax sp. PAMC 28711 TaxID=1795631 RepID=UPI00078E581D|nr:alpha/beta fold hydrolase [Variovorax sp. PAMC 28711]AMM24687.1 alpha/beta hydrolase [Variovorax sp. PAMC 28711]